MAGRGDIVPSGFGDRLKAIREEKGLTQKQLGEKADVHANTLAKLERNEQEPNWPLVLKLANALGVDCTRFSGTGGTGIEATPPSVPSGADLMHADEAQGSEEAKFDKLAARADLAQGEAGRKDGGGKPKKQPAPKKGKK